MNRLLFLQLAFGILIAPLCTEALQLVLDATMSPPATLPTE
ncbi:hypothetical protein GBAR_LOCUS6138, partial [Geodia barretti]